MLKLYWYGRSAAQSFHENLILLHIACQIGRKLRQRFPLGLRHIEYRCHLECGNMDFLFFDDSIAVLIQYRSLGVRIELHFFNFLLVGRRSDDLDTFFTALHVPPELIAPFVEACHQRGIGALHMNEHDVVYGVSVKAAHGDKVIPVFVALEQLFDALLNTGCDFFDTVFIGLFFSHGNSPFVVVK